MANLLPSSDIFHTSETYFLHFTHFIRFQKKMHSNVSGNCMLCHDNSQNSVGWWSFSSVCSVSYQLVLFLSLSPSLVLLRFCAIVHTEIEFSYLYFLIAHNNKLSVTLSWQKSHLWIAKMNQMKNHGLFSVTNSNAVHVCECNRVWERQ